MSEETKLAFVIEGEECPFPEDGTDMEDLMVFYDYTGFGFEELMSNPDEKLDEDEEAELARKRNNPRVLAAMMHIAYRRKHPGKSEKAIRKIVLACDLAEAMQKFAGDDADPPERSSTSTSPSETSSANGTSGDVSEPSSDPVVDLPNATGTIESDTSSISPHEIYAA